MKTKQRTKVQLNNTELENVTGGGKKWRAFKKGFKRFWRGLFNDLSDAAGRGLPKRRY